VKCRVCERPLETRMGACWDCVENESLIDERKDMREKPVARTIEGSEALNILRKILVDYGVVKKESK
jgi:hypothetical protein